MTPEQKAAFIVAQAAMLNSLIAGMQAENAMRSHRGETPAYVEEDFFRLHQEYASVIGHNAVLEYFQS